MEANSEIGFGWNGYKMAWLDTAFTSHAAGCGDPNPPIRGFIEGFDSAVEGATIHYSCRPGLVPVAQMRAACTNMSWNPDPATLECREPRAHPGNVKTACKLWWIAITYQPTLKTPCWHYAAYLEMSLPFIPSSSLFSLTPSPHFALASFEFLGIHHSFKLTLRDKALVESWKQEYASLHLNQ